MGSNAMPFRTETQKCNHWATRRLLELGRKFKGSYKQMNEMQFLLTALSCFGE